MSKNKNNIKATMACCISLALLGSACISSCNATGALNRLRTPNPLLKYPCETKYSAPEFLKAPDIGNKFTDEDANRPWDAANGPLTKKGGPGSPHVAACYFESQTVDYIGRLYVYEADKDFSFANSEPQFLYQANNLCSRQHTVATNSKFIYTAQNAQNEGVNGALYSFARKDSGKWSNVPKIARDDFKMVIIDALCASEKYLAVVSELNENVRRLDVYKANDIFNRIQTTGIPPSAELGVSCQVSGDFVIIGTIPESPTPVAADSVLATVFNIKTNRTTDLLPPSDVVDAGDSLEDWNTVSIHEGIKGTAALVGQGFSFDDQEVFINRWFLYEYDEKESIWKDPNTIKTTTFEDAEDEVAYPAVALRSDDKYSKTCAVIADVAFGDKVLQQSALNVFEVPKEGLNAVPRDAKSFPTGQTIANPANAEFADAAITAKNTYYGQTDIEGEDNHIREIVVWRHL